MSGLRPVLWVGLSQRDLRRFPTAVRRIMGFALYLAQHGQKHPNARPLIGFGGASVLEIVEEHDGDAYRGVYTVLFAEAVYVLHAFQKKSKRGAKTPLAEIALIRERLRRARAHHEGVEEP